ncbi:hypothetical protein BH18ACT3_BH18ACT3_18150 [soil metagenome]
MRRRMTSCADAHGHLRRRAGTDTQHCPLVLPSAGAIRRPGLERSTSPRCPSIARARAWVRRLKNRGGRISSRSLTPSWSSPPQSPHCQRSAFSEHGADRIHRRVEPGVLDVNQRAHRPPGVERREGIRKVEQRSADRVHAGGAREAHMLRGDVHACDLQTGMDEGCPISAGTRAYLDDAAASLGGQHRHELISQNDPSWIEGAVGSRLRLVVVVGGERRLSAIHRSGCQGSVHRAVRSRRRRRRPILSGSLPEAPSTAAGSAATRR